MSPTGPSAGPPTRPRVVLVGAMGAGKSTVGALLARRWSVEVRDTDHDVELAAGKTVSEIFVDDGEERFRALEKDAVLEALTAHAGVLALGGGAVLDADTRAALREHQVVFLRVGLADAATRVGLGVGRPLLLGNVRSRIKAILDERAPIYTEVAQATVDTDGRDAETVTAEVAALVEARESDGEIATPTAAPTAAPGGGRG